MFIRFDNFRVSHVDKKGDTGFETSIYYGKTKVGKAWREDGKKKIEDIKYKITKDAESLFSNLFKYKKKISIDGNIMPWSIELAVFSLMENKFIYDSIKKTQRHNKIIVQFEKEPYFSIINVANTPQNFKEFEKNSVKKVETTAEAFINMYDDLKKA